MSFIKRITFLGGETIVEIGNLEIGGSIQTAEIERGMKRIDSGLKGVASSGKAVGSDFERIAVKGKRMAKIFGTMAIAGTAALTGWVKGTPAVAGSMAKINLSLLKLKMSVGEALAPVFEKAANGLNKLSNWANEHPDLFGGIVTGITTLGIAAAALKVGGWIRNIFEGFWGVLKKIAGFVFPKIPKAAAAASGITAGGVATGATIAAGAVGLAFVAGEINNLAKIAEQQKTYSKISGIPEQEFIQAYVQGYQGTVYNGASQEGNQQFQINIGNYTRNLAELEEQYFIP